MSVSTANEEAIIKERLAINEASYKRLIRLAGQPKDQSWLESTLEELSRFGDLVTKLQLQLNTGIHEIETYQEQAIANGSQLEELKDRSVELNDKLSAAQKSRNQRAECNQLVDSMLKAKKVDVGTGAPIVALLNNSRSDEKAACLVLEEEIAELERQKDAYNGLWRERKDKFRDLKQHFESFKDQIMQTGRIGDEDQEDGLSDADNGSTRQQTPAEPAEPADTPMEDAD